MTATESTSPSPAAAGAERAAGDGRLRLSPLPGVAILALAWLAAFNLRTGFIGLGPVLPNLGADLALSHTEASVLVAIPTLLMGLIAIPAGRMTDRDGPERTIALGLALVALAGGLRAVAPSFPWLVGLTILFGAGIGFGQTALPRLMRTHFPERFELVTGVYASGLICGSILSASITGPVLLRLMGEQAWRGPLGLWGAVALVGLIAWAALLRPWRSPRPLAATAADRGGPWSPWRSRGAWIVALLFAAQGLAYYLLIAWLPSIYGEAGLDQHEVALLFAAYNAATLPAILGFPILSGRLGARRPACLFASFLFVAGASGLLIAPLAHPWRWLWPPLAGAGVAGLFALALVMPADVSPRGRTGVAAGMVLGIGYAGSALGPVLAGAVRDLSGSFAVALALLPLIGVGMIVLSLVVPEIGRAAPDGADGE
jgi:MFS transporter, CP family, cyanate transporter